MWCLNIFEMCYFACVCSFCLYDVVWHCTEDILSVEFRSFFRSPTRKRAVLDSCDRFLLRRVVDWVLLARAETHTHAPIHKSYAICMFVWRKPSWRFACQPFWMLLAARVHVKTRIHVKDWSPNTMGILITQKHDKTLERSVFFGV
jgi:hypothetical protein